MLFIRKVYVMRCFPVIFGLISFLPVAVQGQYHLTGSEGPIEAQVGSNVVLPCNVEPPVDMRDGIVEWMFNFSKIVHLFRQEADDRESQDESYKDRTILNHKMLEHGDVSLKLAKVTKNDAGIYTCIVLHRPVLSDERNIILLVVDGEENPNRHSGGDDPAVIGVVVGGGGVVLLIIIISIIICVVRRRRLKQIFQRWSNNSRNEEVINDEEMEIEQLQSNNFY
ncbi:selection and upkeep of intraepithelial T-cells protein 4-like isoform X2 [Gambusia affinis]|uniref:selection and upkeep of intraepithelial T-cells protein 4-like isoform X2 n=1 Tax=Gambusia affinis TaxID=33528 RepID=UPI001CDBCF06|nr:selection and upkeep of intraepithelial T-cells protein 4-like isoform X2 [Gambusia affinis]